MLRTAFLLPLFASAFFAGSLESCVNAAGMEKPALTDRHLDRFIIVPEYKILFCYIEKVRSFLRCARVLSCV